MKENEGSAKMTNENVDRSLRLISSKTKTNNESQKEAAMDVVNDNIHPSICLSTTCNPHSEICLPMQPRIKKKKKIFAQKKKGYKMLGNESLLYTPALVGKV